MWPYKIQRKFGWYGAQVMSNWGKLHSYNARQKNQLSRLGKPLTLCQLSMSIEFVRKASKIEH